MGWTDFTDVDGMAIAMMMAMTLSFGVILMLVGTIIWNARRRNRAVEDLLDEVSKEEVRANPVAARAKTKGERKSWEKDGDWWKNAG